NTSEEWAKYAELYHPISTDSFVSKVKNLDLKSLIKDLVKTEPDKVIVYEDRFYESFDSLINEENWSLIKAWMLT
ncbi:peptidase M13, partial [Lactococcus lactis]